MTPSAAEEARGQIRWLRPYFRAPKAQKPTQVAVPGTEPEVAPTAAAGKPTAQV